MSKKRSSSQTMPRSLRSTIINFKNSQFTQDTQKPLRSSLWQRTRHRTIKTEHSHNDDNKLSTIYNKNIGKYRDLVNQNDKTLLPFISSLRQSSFNRNTNKKQLFKTQLQPFQVAEKQTCNQKIHKDLNDIKGRTKRISNALYRWHNKTGLNIKNNCFFESKLRQTSCQFFKKNTFKNLFNPIQKPLIEQKLYKQSELICHKQKRLFTLQN